MSISRIFKKIRIFCNRIFKKSKYYEKPEIKSNLDVYYFDIMFGKNINKYENGDYSYINNYFFGKKDTFISFEEEKGVCNRSSYPTKYEINGKSSITGFKCIINPLLDKNYPKNLIYKDSEKEIIKKTEKSGLSIEIMDKYKKDISNEINAYNENLFDVLYKEFIWDSISEIVKILTLKYKLTNDQLSFINIIKEECDNHGGYLYPNKKAKTIIEESHSIFPELIDVCRFSNGEMSYHLTSLLWHIDNKLPNSNLKYDYDESYYGGKKIRSSYNIIENQKKVIVTFNKSALRDISKFMKLKKEDIKIITDKLIKEGFNLKINDWYYYSEFN